MDSGLLLDVMHVLIGFRDLGNKNFMAPRVYFQVPRCLVAGPS